MSFLPKKQIKKLQLAQPLADAMAIPQGLQQSVLAGQAHADQIPLQNGNTLICAKTGTGKTWWVLNILMHDYHVVFLCPTVGQVKQCEENYGYREDIAFVYGDKKIPKGSIKQLAKQNLVMTYDQYSRFKAELGKDTILAVDECQKLYGAGSYRDKAIQPILKSVKSQKFDRCVFLTATLTEPLYEMLGIHISQYYEIQKEDELSRNI